MDDPLVGQRMRDLPLPDNTALAIVIRDGGIVLPAAGRRDRGRRRDVVRRGQRHREPGVGPGARRNGPPPDRIDLRGARVSGHTEDMDPVIALRQIAYYKDRAREDPRRVMAYRNAADILERTRRRRARTPRHGQQLAVVAGHRTRRRRRSSRRRGPAVSPTHLSNCVPVRRISVAATSVRHCAATCMCTRTGRTARRRSRR